MTQKTNGQQSKAPVSPLRAPPRREWPRGLRRFARKYHLYAELDLLRRLSPSTLAWLIENWDTNEGKQALNDLRESGAYLLVRLPNDGV